MSEETPESREGQALTSSTSAVQPPPPGSNDGAPHASGHVHAHHTAIQFRFLEQLKHRNVIRVGILYLVVCWLILDPVHVVFHMLEVPAWAGRLVVILMAVGFPAVLLFAWVYEITPEGLKPTAEVDPHKSIRQETGQRLNRAIVVVLALAVAYLLTDKFWLSRHLATEQPVAAVAPATINNSVATAISEKSVAVLPFINMSEDKSNEYFSDGLSEELIDMLTKIPELRVPASTSSFYFKGKQVTVQDIAKALSVAHLLEGSVRKSGNHLRITAQLVRADNGYHLWSETYDRQLDDVFKVQDEIARAVVKALKISLMGGSLPESTGTQNIEAYNLFLQARSMFRHANEPADYERIAEYLRRAVDADPQFANAWALLSRALLAVATPVDVRPDHQLIEEARRVAKQALKLNSALSGPHLAYASILWGIDFDLRDAETQIHQALELAPNSPEVLYWAATLTMYRGQFDSALELAQKSIAIDPVDPSAYATIAWIYYFAGKYPEALAANRKMLDLDPGAHYAYHERAAFVLLTKGDPAAAISEIESDKEVREKCSCLVLAYDALGRKGEADATLANLEKHHADDIPYEIAIVYANRGELDQAFGWFNRAYRQRDTLLYNLKVSLRTRNLRSDPRFNALLRKLDLVD